MEIEKIEKNNRLRSVTPVTRRRRFNENEKKEVKDEKEDVNVSRCQQFLHTFFLEHPMSVKMTYLQHFYRAISLGFQTGMATCALFVHGIVPKFFPHTGSSIIKKLYHEIETFEEH